MVKLECAIVHNFRANRVKEPVRSQIVLTKDFNSQFIIIGLKVKYLEEKNDSI